MRVLDIETNETAPNRAGQEIGQGAGEGIGAARLRIAAALLDCEPERLRTLWEGGLAAEHERILDSVLPYLPLDEAEIELCRRIAGIWPAGDEPDLRALLAAMLMAQAHSLPCLPRLDAIPPWLRPCVAAYLLRAPRLFMETGEAADYAARFGEIATLFAADRHDPAEGGFDAAEFFVRRHSLVQLYFNDFDLKEIYRTRARIIESWLLAKGLPLAYRPTLRLPPADRCCGPRRLKIGILARHFGPQTESYFMLSHIDRFPRDRSSLHLYSLAAPASELAVRARALADSWTVLPADLKAQVDRIRQDDLDLLYVGTNVTAAMNEIALLAAFRLANIQVISASSPVSPAFTQADAYLSAVENETDDPAAAAHDYAERLVCLPGIINAYAFDLDASEPVAAVCRADLGVPEDAVLFFSAANYFKLLPELVDLWAQILAALPGSHLCLLPFNANWARDYAREPFRLRILGQLHNAGVGPERLHLLEPVPGRADVLALMRLADVYLDSYPFGGACSLLDPLEVGLPPVTMGGLSFRSNVGKAMAGAVGLEDCVAESGSAYLDLALDLARDAERRRAVAARLERVVRDGLPFYDRQTFACGVARQFESLIDEDEARNAALCARPASELWQEVNALVARIGPDNPFFRRLSDTELVRQLILPALRSRSVEAPFRRMIDVGACLGEMAKPFLANGFRVEMIEPDPQCHAALGELVRGSNGLARHHHAAVTDRPVSEITFNQSATGLSGLGRSPFDRRARALTVPATSLAAFCRAHALERLDFLKIDAEGFDFEALFSHDWERWPPIIAMVEFGTLFEGQGLARIEHAIGRMAGMGYTAIVFSYDDHGNFRERIWTYDLIGLRRGEIVPMANGEAQGNILFAREDDSLTLLCLIRLLESFLSHDRRPQLAAAVAGR